MADFEKFYKDLQENNPDINKKYTALSEKEQITIGISGLVLASLFLMGFLLNLFNTTIGSTPIYFFIFLLAFVTLIVCIFLFAKFGDNRIKKNKILYKKNIITNLVKFCDSNLDYTVNSIIDISEYTKGTMQTPINYKSEDLIYGKINNKLP